MPQQHPDDREITKARHLSPLERLIARYLKNTEALNYEDRAVEICKMVKEHYSPWTDDDD